MWTLNASLPTNFRTEVDFISDEPEIREIDEEGVSITNRDREDSLELWHNDAEDIVNAIMDRYRDVEGSAWKDQLATDQRTYIDGWKSTVAYLPSVTDGDIWKVAVTVAFRLHNLSK